MLDAVTLTLNPAIDLYTSVARVESEQKLRCAPPEIHAGGGGVNVARVLTGLGRRARAVYAAGGHTGEWLEDLLVAQGVEQERVPIAAPTREDVTVLDRSSGEQYRFVMPGMRIADAEWRTCLDRVVDAARRARLVVASGSLPEGVPTDCYARLAARLAASADAPGGHGAHRDARHGRGADTRHGDGARHGRGAEDRYASHDEDPPRLAVDTAGDALRAALDHGVFLVAPNRRELDDQAGRPLDRDGRRRFLAQLVEQGRAEIVVAKLDADGAVAYSAAAGHVEVRAPDVRVRSAVGAGDSFLGAFLAALQAGWRLEEATRFAVASGSATCTRAGTELADLDTVRSLWATMTDRPMPPL